MGMNQAANQPRPLNYRDRLNQSIERSDRPLLGLAVVSIMLYLLDLRGLPVWAAVLVDILNLVTDALFVADLVLKLMAQGKSYLDSPWFLIDLLSCLPVVDTIANGFVPFRSFRFVRGFRILRILRGLRLLRALKTIPAFEQFARDDEGPESRRSKPQNDEPGAHHSDGSRVDLDRILRALDGE